MGEVRENDNIMDAEREATSRSPVATTTRTNHQHCLTSLWAVIEIHSDTLCFWAQRGSPLSAPKKHINAKTNIAIVLSTNSP